MYVGSDGREKESSARSAVHGSKQQHFRRDRSIDDSRERSAGRAGERQEFDRRDRIPARSRLKETERDREKYPEPSRYRDTDSNRARASDRNSDRDAENVNAERERRSAATNMRTSSRAEEPQEPSLGKMTLDQLVKVVAAVRFEDLLFYMPIKFEIGSLIHGHSQL